MPSKYVVIDGQRFLIDGKKGNVYPEILPTQLAIHDVVADEVLPGTIPVYSRKWVKSQSKSVAATTCRWFNCNKVLRGKQLRYCSYRCKKRMNDLVKERKRRGKASWLEAIDGEPVLYHREFPNSIRKARKLFADHIAEGVCPYRSEEDDICMGTNNPSSLPDNPRCLIYATLADDLRVWIARNKLGMGCIRRYTTEDGTWL